MLEPIKIASIKMVQSCLKCLFMHWHYSAVAVVGEVDGAFLDGLGAFQNFLELEIEGTFLSRKVIYSESGGTFRVRHAFGYSAPNLLILFFCCFRSRAVQGF